MDPVHRHLRASVHGAHRGIAEAGSLAYIDLTAGDLHLHRIDGIPLRLRGHRGRRLRRRGIHRGRISRLLPVGVKGLALGGHVQHLHPGTAGSLGIPATEHIAIPAGDGDHLGSELAVVALHVVCTTHGADGAALGIEQRIAIPIRGRTAVHTFQIDAGLRQPAADMAHTSTTAGHGVDREGIDQLVSRGAGGQSVHQRLTLPKPAAAHIEHEGDHRVELPLFIRQTVLVHEGVHILLVTRHGLAKLRVRLFLGHGRLIVLRHQFLGTPGAITDSIQSVRIHIRRPGEALELLDDGDHVVAGFHGRGRADIRRQKTGQQTDRQDQTKHPFLHGKWLLDRNFSLLSL